MTSVDRRQFLKYSGFTSLAVLCGNMFFIQRGNAEDPYYQKDLLMKNFKETVDAVSQLLAPELGPERTLEMARDALANFERLIPGLPAVGGTKNLISYLVPVAAWYVALYGSLRQFGKTAENTGKILYDLDETQYKAMTGQQKQAMTEKLFSPKYRQMFSDWAVWTQRREYPANWVAQYMDGRGGNFDYGCDYTECAMVKYVTQQRVPELAPYICLADFPSSKAFNSGLVRTKTIATGDGLCDFRYKKGRPVSQDWSTEIGKIKRSGKG